MQRKMPVKTSVINLEGDYEGWEFLARVNPPMRVIGDLASGDFDRIIPALAELVLKWNFVDENGEKMPGPGADTIGDLPYDLATKMAELVIRGAQQLPKV